MGSAEAPDLAADAQSRGGPVTAAVAAPGRRWPGSLRERERETGREEAEAGAGPPRGSRQARGGCPRAGSRGRAGAGTGRATGARPGAVGTVPSPRRTPSRRRRRCCSRHPSAGGGVADQAAPQSPTRPGAPAPPRGLPARRSRGGAPRPAYPRWGPPGPGRHVRGIRWHGGLGARDPEAQPPALGEVGTGRQELSLQALGPPASAGEVLAVPPYLPGLQPPRGLEREVGRRGG